MIGHSDKNKHLVSEMTLLWLCYINLCTSQFGILGTAANFIMNYGLKLHFHWKNSIQCFSFVFCMNRDLYHVCFYWIRANFFACIHNKVCIFHFKYNCVKTITKNYWTKLLGSYNYLIKKVFSINEKMNKKKNEGNWNWWNKNESGTTKTFWLHIRNVCHAKYIQIRISILRAQIEQKMSVPWCEQANLHTEQPKHMYVCTVCIECNIHNI